MSVLVLAGIDPSGRAGLTRDLWALERVDVPALAVPSCVTIQTEARHELRASDPAWIARALAALRDEHEVRVVKTGLVADGATWDAALPHLRALANDGCALVVDPCRGPSRGGFEVESAARDALLGPLAACGALLTPNLPELAWLSGVEERELEDAATVRDAAHALSARGYSAVVVKGGHGAADSALVDRYYSAGGEARFERLRMPGARRGTGCVFASFLAAALWQGLDPKTATRLAGHQLGQSWSRLAPS